MQIAEANNKSIDAQVGIQQSYVDDLTSAYSKMVEIYGESAAESINLQEILDKEKHALEKLKNSYTAMSEAIEDTLEDKKEEYELDAKNAKLKSELWNETAGKEAQEYEKRINNIKSLNEQLEEQGGIVKETADAYRQMVEQYGINSDESKKFENQLLEECVVYEKLKNRIEELYAVEEYGRKEREDVIFSLNDYIKNNKEFLLSTGMTEEEIYEAAKDATGYNDFVDYFLNKPKEESVISSSDLIGSILNAMLKENFGSVSDSFLSDGQLNLQSFESIFTDFDGVLQSLGGITEIFDFIDALKDITSSNINNSYSSVYNLNAASDSSIADQLYAIKKYDSMKKARGLT